MTRRTEEDHTSNNKYTDSKNTEKYVVPSPDPRRWRIIWPMVIFFTVIHIGALYGTYLFFTKAKWQTCLFVYLMFVVTAISVTAGAHRLWAHKTYKATLPLRIILLAFFTMAFENSVIIWVRDHRMHHKYCDTDADPHNAERGFFFSHIGWLLIKKHPDVKAKGPIELNDLWDDPILRFQHNHYVSLALLISIIIPTYIPVLWGEKVSTAFYTCVCLRYIITLHASAMVNSVAHTWGTKPYDKQIRPVDTKIVSFLAVGEGFHNYHHTFPWDYRTAELGGYSLNLTKLFIDIMAKVGWAYDLKSVPQDLIERRVKRTGDGTHPVWGWDDQDLLIEDRKASIIR